MDLFEFFISAPELNRKMMDTCPHLAQLDSRYERIAPNMFDNKRSEYVNTLK